MELGIGLPKRRRGRPATTHRLGASCRGRRLLVARNDRPHRLPELRARRRTLSRRRLTERIKLVTDVMLGPLRANPAMIAKQFLSLDALAGGDRAVLGIGVGGREDDYAISGMDMSGRGMWLDDALAKIRAIWNGDGELESKVGPRPSGKGPSLMVGG